MAESDVLCYEVRVKGKERNAIYFYHTFNDQYCGTFDKYYDGDDCVISIKFNAYIDKELDDEGTYFDKTQKGAKGITLEGIQNCFKDYENYSNEELSDENLEIDIDKSILKLPIGVKAKLLDLQLEFFEANGGTNNGNFYVMNKKGKIEEDDEWVPTVSDDEEDDDIDYDTIELLENAFSF